MNRKGQVVPGNRWDLVDTTARVDPPTVTVVIPTYAQQAQLDLVLAALGRQTHPSSRLQIVVADDGSPDAPRVDVYDGEHRPTVVRQEDRGFRAAAARNLGAARADGEVLCFLDADTVPEPRYVEHAVALPAAAPDALVVGRRRHADLSGWTPERLRDWFAGGEAPAELTEPRWLRDAYTGSRDLLDADHRSYRFVISAVLTCTRALFDEVGAFDESFVGYGGEDWELAHRAWHAGAVFAHARDALAWHDGPEWAQRSAGGDRAAKNREALALLPLVTDPVARRETGLMWPVPEVAARIDCTGHSAASLMHTVGSVLAHGDCRILLLGDDAGSLHGHFAHDPRIVVDGGVDPRSRCVLDVRGRALFADGAVARLLAESDRRGGARVSVRHGDDVSVVATPTRACARARRWSATLGCGTDDAIAELFGSVEVHAEPAGISAVEQEPSLQW